MPDSEQSAPPICAICGQRFRDDETVVKYQAWPRTEKLCHIACAMALSKAQEAKTQLGAAVTRGETGNAAARASHYRSKSKESYIIAQTMKNQETRQFMLSVADDYQVLAEMFERLSREAA